MPLVFIHHKGNRKSSLVNEMKEDKRPIKESQLQGSSLPTISRRQENDTFQIHISQ